MAKKKTAKKSSSKRSAKKAPAKTAKKAGGAPKDMRKVTTGGGASPGDVGRALVQMFNKGQFHEIEKKYWAPAVVSCEGEGVAMEWVGRKAVTRKGEEWFAQNRIHGASAEGPYVGATGFAVKFRMDIENLGTGHRGMMEEVGVYSIRNGKIVREEFMYGTSSAAS
jgi:hypothetical protein